MNPWTIWRIRRNRARKWVRECRCGIAYWTDSSGQWDHRVQHGHAPGTWTED